MIHTKRVYEPPAEGDGYRVLIDRLWPRGLSKEKAAIDEWLKDVAVSDALRKWFGHDPARWPGFQKRYRAELAAHAEALDALAARASKSTLTLTYGAKDEAHNNAVVLAEVLAERVGKRSRS